MSVLPLSGKWVWKDDANLGYPVLDFESFSPAQEKADHGKAVDKSERKGLKGLSNLPTVGRHRITSLHPCLQRVNKRKHLRAAHEFVTLMDVKDVALELFYEKNPPPLSYKTVNMFDLLLYDPTLDNFLIHALLYFSRFFHKIDIERKPDPSHVEPSQAEKDAIQIATQEVALSLKMFGRSYCALSLGIGLDDLHHMGRGAKHNSAMLIDRNLFEILHLYMVYFIFVAFRRPPFGVIQAELGRLLRSNTFNPSVRVRNFHPSDEEGLRQWSRILKLSPDVQLEKIKTMNPKEVFKSPTPAEYRRQHPKRPAIKSIANQRSPALVSILPSSLEESHWLFKRSKVLGVRELAKAGNVDKNVEELQKGMEMWIEEGMIPRSIVNEPMCQYKPETLQPIGIEEDTDAEKDVKSENNGETPVFDPNYEEKSEEERAETAFSRVTEDALPDS